jgi:hypothetical protein
VSESILTSTKSALDIPETMTVWDGNITMFINSVFSTLTQLGIGPSTGYMITSATETWDAFIGDDPELNSVKAYMFLKVKLLFDPPQLSYLIEAYKDQARELEWRLNTKREGEDWTPPVEVDNL